MGAPVLSEGPPNEGFTTLMSYDGSNNLEYVGIARSVQPNKKVFTKADATLTSIVVLTNVATANITAHGLAVGQRVTVSGATVDADLNGSYVVATVPGVDSFTFATVNVANATYTEATLAVETTAPRTNDAVWAIKKLSYTTTYNTAIRWAEGSSATKHIWDNRTSLAYQ